jgi:alpha-glucoside transport system substrate-binding protein
MALPTRLRAVFLPGFLILVLALGIAACGDDDDDDDDDTGTPAGESPDEESPDEESPDGGGGDIGEVEVLGLWGDEELVNFQSMVAPWEDETGGSMSFTGDRAITSLLTTRVEGGSPPDVAIPAEIGLFQQFAAEGELRPLSECDGLVEMIEEEYPQSFVDLGTVDGELYGFFMKAGNKGTIFYDPAYFEENGLEALDASASFDDLVGLSDEVVATGIPAWSHGQEAGDGSGFPASDWVQQIILNEHGADVYDGLIDGSVPYTDDAVADAWQKFGQVALTEGYSLQSAQEMIATNFVDSTHPPFEEPPQAGMVYMGSFAGGFITDQFPDAVPEEDFDFFPFPGGGITGDANIVYAFDMNDSICSFLKHIASAEAQQIWVEAGGFTSVNETLSLDSYTDPVQRKAAQQLLEAPEFRFDLDDGIGGAAQTAIFEGILAFIQNPDDLESILQNVEAARTR